MFLTLEMDREEDGRYIAEVPDLPGVLAYGATREEAVARVQALALRVLADRLDHGEPAPNLLPWISAQLRIGRSLRAQLLGSLLDSPATEPGVSQQNMSYN